METRERRFELPLGISITFTKFFWFAVFVQVQVIAGCKDYNYYLVLTFCGVSSIISTAFIFYCFTQLCFSTVFRFRIRIPYGTERQTGGRTGLVLRPIKTAAAQ